jgi:hypothetical protein
MKTSKAAHLMRGSTKILFLLLKESPINPRRALATLLHDFKEMHPHGYKGIHRLASRLPLLVSFNRL